MSHAHSIRWQRAGAAAAAGVARQHTKAKMREVRLVRLRSQHASAAIPHTARARVPLPSCLVKTGLRHASTHATGWHLALGVLRAMRGSYLDVGGHFNLLPHTRVGEGVKM